MAFLRPQVYLPSPHGKRATSSAVFSITSLRLLSLPKEKWRVFINRVHGQEF